MFDVRKARKLTEEACGEGNHIFDEMVSRIETRIVEVANSGKRELHDPLSQAGDPMPWALSNDTRNSIRVELEKRGFTWTHHPRLEGNDPRECEYDTISW